MPVKKTEIKNEVNGMSEVGQETQAKEAEDLRNKEMKK